MQVPIFLFMYGCITESYGYYVITKWVKGNIVPASLWHFSGNLVFNFYALGQNGTMVYGVATLLYGICVGVFIYYIRKQK